MTKNKKFKKWGKKENELPGMAFVGCLFIGLAAGLYYGRPDVGVLGGLGAGFLAYIAVSLKLK